MRRRHETDIFDEAFDSRKTEPANGTASIIGRREERLPGINM